ncbi:MAG: exodeoxyribonuclease VII small subunit [Bacilli bacterium]
MSETLSFEQALAELEAVVNKLERGDVPLEEAIATFQQGLKLSQLCHTKLTVAEQQLTQLLGEDGSLTSFAAGEQNDNPIF